ncbi:MAG TPA: hypothetical protein PK649_10975 [Vicingus sp.]|nr:hypothetical protein [Flavobacteriales bacterium]HRN42578.1 hypothetical protein [Vicingus sp.]
MLRILIIVISLLYISKNANANIEAIYVENSVQIKWTCIEQNNVSYFIIEKSKNGKHFKKLSMVTTGKGYHSFIETDPTPFHGISFYRICYVNTDGTMYYSEIVSIRKLNELKQLPSKLKNTSTLNTLVILKDKSNNEFYAKLNIKETKGVLICETLNEEIKTGEFVIVASESDELVGNKIVIFNRNPIGFSDGKQNTISQ